MRDVKLGWKSATSIIIGFLFLGAVTCLFDGIPGIDLIFYLVGGWVMYLIRVVPRVQVRWDLVASAVVYSSILLVGSQLFLRWLYREMKGGKWRWGWTAGGLVIVLLMFVAGTAAVGVVHQVTWLARSPEPMFHQWSHERANRVKCASNLRQIGQGLLLYANDHGGVYPDDLSSLVIDELNPEVLICPSSNDDKAVGKTLQETIQNLKTPGRCSYIYFGKGLRTPVADTLVIAVEPPRNHEDEGANVLFGDGRVDWLPKKEAALLMKQLGLEGVKRGHIEPASRPTQTN
jgi:prepilin-type processing-associated H-X9-DG protein